MEMTQEELNAWNTLCCNSPYWKCDGRDGLDYVHIHNALLNVYVEGKDMLEAVRAAKEVLSMKEVYASHRY